MADVPASVDGFDGQALIETPPPAPARHLKPASCTSANAAHHLRTTGSDKHWRAFVTDSRALSRSTVRHVHPKLRRQRQHDSGSDPDGYYSPSAFKLRERTRQAARRMSFWVLAGLVRFSSRSFGASESFLDRHEGRGLCKVLLFCKPYFATCRGKACQRAKAPVRGGSRPVSTATPATLGQHDPQQRVGACFFRSAGTGQMLSPAPPPIMIAPPSPDAVPARCGRTDKRPAVAVGMQSPLPSPTSVIIPKNGQREPFSPARR